MPGSRAGASWGKEKVVAHGAVLAQATSLLGLMQPCGWGEKEARWAGKGEKGGGGKRVPLAPLAPLG